MKMKNGSFNRGRRWEGYKCDDGNDDDDFVDLKDEWWVMIDYCEQLCYPSVF